MAESKKNNDNIKDKMDLQKKAKIWILACLGLAIAGMILLALPVLIVDPFFQYHAPLKGFPYVIDNQLSQNPGLAKNMDYDSILVGSSMTNSFHMNDFKELCGKNTIKMTYNGAYPKDISNILEVVFRSHPDVETVYYGLDPIVYAADSETIKYEIPKHLYDNNVWNDLPYLYNKDVLSQYIINPMMHPERKTDMNEIYCPEYGEEAYNISHVLDNYAFAEISKEKTSKDAKINATEANLECNILPYIENYPNTEFILFVPPYSILYWDQLNRFGEMEAVLFQYQYLLERLLEYDNVKIFFFTDREEMVTDFNNYVDYTHFHPKVSRYIVECFANGGCEMTKENYKSILEHMEELAKEYPYEQLFAENGF